MKAVIAVALLALTVPVGAATPEETKLGAGVTLKVATPIASLVAKPADYVGKTIRIDGVATAVCTHMGCWMAVAPESDPEGKTVRLKVEDGVIVFPVTAKGKKVSAEGMFEALGDEHGKRLWPERGATSLRQGYGGPPKLQRRRKPPSESEREPSAAASADARAASAGGGAPAPSERWGPASTNKEAAGEHAKQDAQASATYQIKATGAVIH